MIEFLVVYAACGFLGWLIDTVYRSAYAKAFVSNTYFPFFANIYGMGGILVFVNFRYLPFSISVQILFGTASLVLLEL